MNLHNDTFPLVVLDPPTATGNFANNTVPLGLTYSIRMAFMRQASPDRNEADNQAAVNLAQQTALKFLAQLGLNENTEDYQFTIAGIRIQPFHSFDFSAHITNGVLLEFSIETEDTIDYCTELTETIDCSFLWDAGTWDSNCWT